MAGSELERSIRLTHAYKKALNEARDVSGRRNVVAAGSPENDVFSS